MPECFFGHPFGSKAMDSRLKMRELHEIKKIGKSVR